MQGDEHMFAQLGQCERYVRNLGLARHSKRVVYSFESLIPMEPRSSPKED